MKTHYQAENKKSRKIIPTTDRSKSFSKIEKLELNSLRFAQDVNSGSNTSHYKTYRLNLMSKI